MARIGISEDMLVAAQELGETLERANQGLITVQDSLSSLQSFARRLDLDANEMYEKAKVAMAEKDENKAKKLLLDRHATMEKLKGVLKDCAEMKNRMETMEQNVSVLERKAIEMETLLKRSVGAKALQDSGALGLSLQDEDPLLRKFRDLGID
jgi:phage shock protein A